MLRIDTPRLELVASTPGIAGAEMEGLRAWCAPLGVDPPVSWPPPLDDTSTLRWFASAIERDPDGAGWYTWYVVQRAPRALAGHAGFKGRPERGSVELGYSLLPSFQGRGYGTELVQGLAAWAFADRSLDRILADTFPEFIASVRILEKNGFTLCGRARPPGAIRYELRRSVFEARSRLASEARG